MEWIMEQVSNNEKPRFINRKGQILHLIASLKGHDTNKVLRIYVEDIIFQYLAGLDQISLAISNNFRTMILLTSPENTASVSGFL